MVYLNWKGKRELTVKGKLKWLRGVEPDLLTFKQTVRLLSVAMIWFEEALKKAFLKQALNYNIN